MYIVCVSSQYMYMHVAIFTSSEFSTSSLLHAYMYISPSLSDHPYFVGVQYHPEYLTRPMLPSPPYLGLVMAACNKLEGYLLRNCQLSPRASYEYDSEDDDDITQALHVHSPCPPEIVVTTARLQVADQ